MPLGFITALARHDSSSFWRSTRFAQSDSASASSLLVSCFFFSLPFAMLLRESRHAGTRFGGVYTCDFRSFAVGGGSVRPFCAGVVMNI